MGWFKFAISLVQSPQADEGFNWARPEPDPLLTTLRRKASSMDRSVEPSGSGLYFIRDKTGFATPPMSLERIAKALEFIERSRKVIEDYRQNTEE